MRAALALAAMLAAPARAEAPSVPRFVEETAAGVEALYSGGWDFMVGGGVAVFDCDDDGRPDMLTAGGEGPAQLFRNASRPGGPLRFEALAEPAPAATPTGVTGAYALDVDADGRVDLILLRSGEALALRGLGGCRFARANEAWGFEGGDAWWTAFAATWEQGSDWPTLALGAYIDREEEGFPWGACTDNVLIRPDPAGGGFAPPAPLTPSHCALSMLFTDWDRTGRRDLRVSNDREYYKGGQEQLWRMAPGGPPRLWTEAEGWARLRVWGMGIASADIDHDGYPETFLTSMADNKLQRLAEPRADPPAPVFEDVAFALGATAHRPHTGDDLRPSTAWHAQFEDVNNDGRIDLFVAKGNVEAMPDFAQADPNTLLLGGPDGRFHEAAAEAGVASMGRARGAALADFNLDGLLDLVVVNRGDPVELWRNDGPSAGRWLQLRLRQPGGNRDAIGAWIEARRGGIVARREVTVGGGHAGGVHGWVHLGLGAEDAPEVRVIWPDGEAGPWTPLAADAFHVIDREAGARRWAPE